MTPQPRLQSQAELLRLGRRAELQRPPVPDVELARQAPHLLANGLRLRGAEVGAAGIEALVVGQLLGPILGQVLEEMLPRARSEEEQIRPDAGRSGLTGGADDLAQLLGAVGD